VSRTTLEILLVEDNRADADLVREALATWVTATHLTVLEDGDQALRYLRRDRQFSAAPIPDLVFLDWHLPRKNGSEFLREMKSDENLAAIQSS
jgi:two-component system, chemotaxis family, response regulator Rcp1